MAGKRHAPWWDSRRYALFCVDSPVFKKIVDKLGNTVTPEEAERLGYYVIPDGSIFYDSTLVYYEGSPAYERLKADGWVYKGHKYDVRKEVLSPEEPKKRAVKARN